MITKKGYQRIWCRVQKRLRMEHVIVWEKANGAIPQGMQVHHRNGDKLDNRIENLEIMTALQHKRAHGGCTIVDGVELKPCSKCRTVYPVSDYYKNGPWISGWCRPCRIALSMRNKRERRARKEASENARIP